MFLSDSDIKAAMENGDLVIDPFNEQQLQPASYDVTLDRRFLRFDTARLGACQSLIYEEGAVGGQPVRRGMWGLDPLAPPPEEAMVEHWVGTNATYWLQPGEFLLGSTIERVRIPSIMCASIDGKSSRARLGLAVHVTGGFIDPGFRGPITLEICNLNSLPIALRPSMAIGQLRLGFLQSPPIRSYGHPELGSHYQDSDGVTPAR